MHPLDEIVDFATAEHATLSVRLTTNGVTTTYTRPGCERMTVKGPGLRVALMNLLRRLNPTYAATVGTIIDRQEADDTTNEFICRRMTPRQRERCIELINEMRELKAEVLRPIDEIEPTLASPRSSLNPQNFTAAHDLGGDE